MNMFKNNRLNNSGLAANIVEGVALPWLSTIVIGLIGDKTAQPGRQTAHSVYEGIGYE